MMNNPKKKKSNKSNLPDTVEGIKKAYEKKAVRWFSRQSIVGKILIIIIGILPMLFIAIRTGLLGQNPLEFSCRILPIHIPVIDPGIRVIPLSLTYAIEDASGNIRTGKIGDRCCTGDKITISFKADYDCNALIIGVDSKNVYPIFGEKFNAQGIMKNETYTMNIFTLDSTTGAEAYYLVASVENPDFKSDIQPEIKRIKNISGKGALFSDFDLKLKRGLYYKYVNFRHENCNRR
jgi:hypothetical protein